MRILKVLQFFVSLALVGAALLLFSGGLTAGDIYDAVQRSTSGVNGQPAQAKHSVTAQAQIAPIEGYAYAGKLDATITFSDARGEQTVFDLHYPSDYNQFHDGAGPLWLANWRPEIANNPQVTPVLGNSCLQTINTENLAPSPLYRTGYKEYIVCRVLDEEGPDAPRSYDISKAKPAVIGIIWANRNHQPMDIPRERCIAEMRIWSTEVAKPGDRFMACVFVVDETPQQIEVYAFELTEDRIVEVGGASEGWSRKPVKTRKDAPRLAQYRLMQNWLSNPAAHKDAVKRAFAHLEENQDKFAPARISKLDKFEMKGSLINLTFGAKSDREMDRLRAKSGAKVDRHLYGHIRKAACGSAERAALLAFQENAATYTYDLYRRNGKPMTRYASFSNMPC